MEFISFLYKCFANKLSLQKVIYRSIKAHAITSLQVEIWANPRQDSSNAIQFALGKTVVTAIVISSLESENRSYKNKKLTIQKRHDYGL